MLQKQLFLWMGISMAVLSAEGMRARYIYRKKRDRPPVIIPNEDIHIPISIKKSVEHGDEIALWGSTASTAAVLLCFAHGEYQAACYLGFCAAGTVFPLLRGRIEGGHEHEE